MWGKWREFGEAEKDEEQIVGVEMRGLGLERGDLGRNRGHLREEEGFWGRI